MRDSRWGSGAAHGRERPHALPRGHRPLAVPTDPKSAGWPAPTGEDAEAVAAFRALEVTRLEVRRDYIAARSALRSALQLTGTVDQIGRLMRSIDRVMRRRGPGPGDADDASDLPFEE